MRHLFIVWIFLLSQVVAHGQAAGVAFRSEAWADVLATAKKTHKPVFFYAWSPSCGPCVGMARDVFPDLAVSKYYNANFISYKANIDEGEGKVLASRYGIRSLPAYLFFTAEGEPLHRSGGGKAATAFLEDGKDALNPGKAYFTLKARYMSSDRTASLLYALSSGAGIQEDESFHSQVTGEYLKTQSAQEMASQKNLEYVFNQYVAYESPASQYFLQNQSAFVPQFGQQAVGRKAVRIISQAAYPFGKQNDLAGLGKLQQSMARLLPAQAAQWQQLAQIHYLFSQPQRNWLAYVDATLAYGQQFAAQDSYTLYEATLFLTAFVNDKALLTKADQLIRQAIAADSSHFYLMARAKLQHKLGNNAEAAALATEASATAAKAGENQEEAKALLAEIKK